MATGSKWMFIGLAIGLVAGISLSNFLKKIADFKSVDNEVHSIAQRFLNNRITKKDSLNFKMLSKSMLKVYQGSNVTDPIGYQRYLERSLRPTSFKIKGIALLSPDTARAFIREFWADTLATLTFLDFVRESGAWKYDGYDVELRYD